MPKLRKDQAVNGLRIAKEKAEVISSANNEFIANLSHDIKTPLSGIIGLAEILTHQLQDKKSSQLAKRILLSGQQLLRLLDDCLETGHLGNEALIFPDENFNLKELLTDLSTLFQPAIEEKKLTLQIHYDSDIPPLLSGSRISIYRLLLNLMGNAIKFTKKGLVTLQAELAKQPNMKSVFIRFTVTDTGIGIAKEKHALIFERFRRGAARAYEGHGLGLSIVNTLVKTMGGEIQVNSEEGHGSEFIVILPLSIPPKQESTAVTAIKSKKATIPIASQPCILLVEDNPTAQKIAHIILTNSGAQVDIAHTGEQALMLFRPGKYQLIFMDIGLPDIPGKLILESIRASEQKQKITDTVPIIGLSAHLTKAMEKEYLQAGMAAVMVKPLTKKRALEVIAHFVLPKKNSATKSKPPKKTSKSLPILDKGYKKELVGSLLKSLPKSCHKMEQAYARGDIDLLLKIVHQLHGGLCYTHTPRLLTAVRTLEVSLKKGRIHRFDGLYQKVLNAALELKNAYQSLA